MAEATRGDLDHASARKAMRDAWLVSLDDITAEGRLDDRDLIGGKAHRLAWLSRHGFAVPDAWVVPATAFTALLAELPPSCEPRSLLRAASGSTAFARAAEAREQILDADVPGALRAALGNLWRTRGASAPWGFAVRSSATCEDGALVSMAGLAETILGVRGEDALVAAVRRVWASIASGRALGYLAQHGVRDVGMAVVVQVMVPATAAGVMFTQYVPGRRERIVNAGFGLGSPVVDGISTPDMLRLDEHGAVLERTTARKARKLVVDGAGTTSAEVTDPDAPALGKPAIAELAEVARELERIEDVPWDVEFAVGPARGGDGTRVWVVQARHVTGLGYPAGGTATTVWSSANVGEALPGVATPFTWSVASGYSESGFRKAFGTLGCSVPRHARLVANVHGRFFLNLTQFMRIAAQVPWLDPRTLIELGGGAAASELAGQVASVSHKGFYARLPVTATRLVRGQLKLDDEVVAFEAYAERAMRVHEGLDLHILPDEGIARKIRDVEELLERTGDVMLTCASSALGTHVLLKAVLARHAPGEAVQLANDLTRGIRDLESARPAIGVMRIVHIARRDPVSRAVLEREDASLADLPDGPTKSAIQSFLGLYGNRAVREVELATPRWKDDPRPVLAMVRVGLRGEARDVERSLARSEDLAHASMQRLLPKLNVVEQSLVRHLVARAQTTARRRERMRAWVTRVLGMLRDVALDADRRLLRLVPELAADWTRMRQEGSPLAAVNAVFFLTSDEVVTALRSARTDLAPLVRARVAEFARDGARPDPPTTFIGAPPAVRLPPSGGDVLHGIGASSGVVEGRARVLLSADEMGRLEPGEILVVRTTDVGWTPLFCIAAGVTTELGGPLSHAAVVARELGVPSVVNVDGATQAIKTGERLRLDGDRGTVERLDTAG